MKSLSMTRASVALIALVQSVSAIAADAPLAVSAKFDLSRASASRGTFFELMSSSNGIKAKLDADYSTPVTVVDVATFSKKASNFAHIAKLQAQFTRGAAGLEAVVAKLAGKSIPVNKMYGTVMGAMNGEVKNPATASRLAGALIPVISLASGKGVLVQLDRDTYCYNFGYAKGTGGTNQVQDSEDRKSGRSYGASIERNAYDPSDNDYLKILGEYAAGADERELRKFYTTIFSILLKSDTSGIKTLSRAGQTVVADFMAIYMAELDRHLMTGLKMYEWENALTEITMLAAYSASNAGVTLDPRGSKDNTQPRELVATSEIKEPGKRLLGFFGIGTDGTGLDGRNKTRRHSLTGKLVAEQYRLDPKLIDRIASLIGKPATSKARSGETKVLDVYDVVMNTINDFNTQTQVKRNADALITSLVEFVIGTRTSASSIKVL